ncbi:MAG TPA: hypothetical protein VN181_16065, partial [Thermoanaerobaculia bacterium]|nr:hypothetical protein [Thermoanaerobaculia bacterium]
DKNGTPMLWMCVRGGSPAAVEALLNAGAELGESKQMIIDTAAESGNDEIRALISRAAEGKGNTPRQ